MRWDGTTGQYDMGFRTYDPGLNQFTSRDMYNGALADAGLATDPFTGSQYAFGGGNPVTNIENDGHTTCDQWGTCQATNTPVHVTSSQLGGPAKQNAYVSITKNVIVQTSDPYYRRMMTAYNAFLKQCPQCISAANGNVSQQEWFWNNVCHPNQGQCNTRFITALASASPTTPSSDNQVFLMGSAFAGGFAEGTVISAAEDSALSCGANSFAGNTRVLLADGKTAPISKVKAGEKVIATDPYRHVTAAKPVVKVIRHHRRHEMATIALVTGAVIQATSKHPVWDATTHRFTYAADLRKGDELLEPNGQTVAVRAVRHYQANLTAYNLDVSGIHTYYVLAGATPVLVHNSCGTGRTVYRGVADNHPAYEDATRGTAAPRGGTSSAEMHQLGLTESPYVSWTTSERAAIRAVMKETGSGVVLKTQIPEGMPIIDVNDQSWADPDLRGEFEILLEGTITGADVTRVGGAAGGGEAPAP